MTSRFSGQKPLSGRKTTCTLSNPAARVRLSRQCHRNSGRRQHGSSRTSGRAAHPRGCCRVARATARRKAHPSRSRFSMARGWGKGTAQQLLESLERPCGSAHWIGVDSHRGHLYRTAIHFGVPHAMQIRLRGRPVEISAGRTAAYWQGVVNGEWEPATFRIFERFIDPERCFIDMGAYVGVTLLYGCQIARRAIGIEPDPIAFAELQRNVRENLPLTHNVELVEACITRRSGPVVFGN